MESSFSSSGKHLEFQEVVHTDITILWVTVGKSIEIGDRRIIVDGNTPSEHIIILVCDENITAVICLEIMHQFMKCCPRYIMEVLQIDDL